MSESFKRFYDGEDLPPHTLRQRLELAEGDAQMQSALADPSDWRRRRAAAEFLARLRAATERPERRADRQAVHELKMLAEDPSFARDIGAKDAKTASAAALHWASTWRLARPYTPVAPFAKFRQNTARNSNQPTQEMEQTP